MPTINQLSQLNQLSGSDQVPVYSASNGDARKASLSTFLAWILESFTSPTYTKQYAAPNANGSNVSVSNTTSSTWLIINPTSNWASMTLTPPPAAQTPDGTELVVFCSQQIAFFTVLFNGAANLFGAPTTLAANSSFRIRFNASDNSWYIFG